MKKYNTGFTLVELLAVIFVFTAIGSLITSILVATLRGNNKTNAINTVETNGSYALSQMARSIRNASTLLVPFPCNNSDNPTTTSAIQLAFPDGTTTTYSCQDGLGNSSITSNSAALVDTNAVVVSACSFTCTQSTPSDYPIINIKFSLQSNGTSTFTEQKASSSAVEFQTAVVIRNLLR